MKSKPIFAFSLVLALGLSACSSASPGVPTATQATAAPASPISTVAAPTATAALPTATTAPQTATTVPATETAVLTTQPTAASTAAPTETPQTQSTAAPTGSPLAQSTVAPTQTPAAQASTGTVASTSDLLPVAAAVAAAKSYHVNVTSTTAAPGQGTTVALDVVKPDRMHAVADVGANKSFEMITIGTNTYLKAGDTWTKAPVPNAVPAPAIAGMMNDDPQKLLGLISQAQQSGTLTKGSTEQVNGTTCQDWVWTPTSAGATNSGGTLCVGSDNLPVQFKSNNGNVVATYSQWNAPISIEPPTTA